MELEEVNASTGEVQISKSQAEVRAEIEGAIVSARHFPRNEMGAYNEILKACKNPKLAEISIYKFPRGGQQIEGPSVNLAREAARIWGNVRFGLNIVRDDEDSVTIEGWAWDVQKNTKVAAQDSFRKLIYRKKGGWQKPDERDLRELINRRGAICVRNCLLQLLPRYIVDEAMATCKQAQAGQIKDPRETIKKMVKAFDGLSVTVAMLEKYLNHPIDNTTAEEIVDLQSVYQSIFDGNSKREEYFDVPGADDDKPGNGKSTPTAENGPISPEDMKPKEKTEKGKVKKEGQLNF